MLRSIASAAQVACRSELLQSKLAAPLILGPVSSERLWKAGHRAVSSAAEVSNSKASEEASKSDDTAPSHGDASAGNEASEGVNTAELQVNLPRHLPGTRRTVHSATFCWIVHMHVTHPRMFMINPEYVYEHRPVGFTTVPHRDLRRSLFQRSPTDSKGAHSLYI